MRLLLLLSALLTALTGAVAGTAASAQPIEASMTATHAKPGNTIKVTVPLPEQIPGAFAAPGTWRATAPSVVRTTRRPFGERRRE